MVAKSRRKEGQFHVCVVVGTRPEIIKLARLVTLLKNEGPERDISLTVVLTGQHADNMMEPFLSYFGIAADIVLDVMEREQSLSSLTKNVISQLDETFSAVKPDIVLVQGDTTTAMSAALVAYYQHIPVAHIEAGLRTYDIEHPFPEELDRRIITLVSCRNYAPTGRAKHNLLSESVDPRSILVTGNTGIDAMVWASREKKDKIPSNVDQRVLRLIEEKAAGKVRLVLLTAHRRENHERGLDDIFVAVKKLTEEFPDIHVIFPVHRNPVVSKKAEQLRNVKQVVICSPLDYQTTALILPHLDLVLTDSGGLQEEASVFSVPTFVLRDSTERMEGVDAGVALLVGTDKEALLKNVRSILGNGDDGIQKAKMYSRLQPYGIGNASEIIFEDLDRMSNMGRGYMCDHRKVVPQPNPPSSDTTFESCKQVLTVVMPTHNGKHYIQEAFESFKNQTNSCWKLIIVDDGSTDGTSFIVDQWDDQNQVVVFHTKGNVGLPGAINLGLRHAKTNWVSWTSDDNNIAPMFVDSLLKSIDAVPEASMVWGGFKYIDEKGAQIWGGTTKIPNFENAAELTFRWNGAAAFAWSTAVGKIAGDFDEELMTIEDLDYWIRLIETNPASAGDTKAIYNYRWHNKSLTLSSSLSLTNERNLLMHEKQFNRTGGADLFFMFPGIRICAKPSLCKPTALKMFRDIMTSHPKHHRHLSKTFYAEKFPLMKSHRRSPKEYKMDFASKQKTWTETYRKLTIDITNNNPPTKKTLVVVPSRSIDDYVTTGRGEDLYDYFNPLGFFDQVYVVSYKESKRESRFGLNIIPTRKDQLSEALKRLKPSIVRAYDGQWACDWIASSSRTSAPLVCSLHDVDSCCGTGALSGNVLFWSTSEQISDVLINKNVSLSQIYGFSNRFNIMPSLSPNRSHHVSESRAKMATGDIKVLAQESDGFDVPSLSNKFGVTKIRHGINVTELSPLCSDADAVIVGDSFDLALTALGSGGFVIASDNSVMREIIQDGVNGRLIKNWNDIRSLEEVITSPNAHKMRAAAPYSVQRYRTELVERWEVGLYRIALNAKAARRLSGKRDEEATHNIAVSGGDAHPSNRIEPGTNSRLQPFFNFSGDEHGGCRFALDAWNQSEYSSISTTTPELSDRLTKFRSLWSNYYCLAIPNRSEIFTTAAYKDIFRFRKYFVDNGLVPGPKKDKLFKMKSGNAFVVNLDRDTQRLKAFMESNNCTDGEVKRFPAYMFHNESFTKDAELVNRYTFVWEQATTFGEPGTAACTLSHMLLLEQFLQNATDDDDYMFVFEDDARFRGSFYQTRSVLAPEDAELVHLTTGGQSYMASIPYDGNSQRAPATRILHGDRSQGFIITARGAKKLKQLMMSPAGDTVIDLAMLGPANLKVYWPTGQRERWLKKKKKDRYFLVEHDDGGLSSIARNNNL